MWLAFFPSSALRHYYIKHAMNNTENNSLTLNNSEDSFDTEEPVSKSQRKREMLELQDLGKELTEITEKLLAKCQLPAELLNAIQEYKRLPNKHEARRRQLQFIGKLMRSVETTQIEQALGRHQHHANLNKRLDQQLEKLREQLLAGSAEALQELILEHPDIDIQYLRQLIRQAQKELNKNKLPSSNKKLFQYLRKLKQTD
ncbi:MAG: hypothetical protein COA71_10230 [SAR86 cluster bacterium]|uniref:Dual-action ribosomal maturation protein DarP n=1 Tax=SAR86 cluster bacterium TaxID=2030880 RepID=A0A2A5C9P6_9GAMM|nr:MAG: hypothetical protein COA71_10230 [SAR86 cluster bacterium]